MSSNEMTTQSSGVDPELLERVRALRLDKVGSSKSGSSGTAWLPWMLCLIMAVAWVGLGSRWYPTATEKAGVSSAAANSTGAGSLATPSNSSNDATAKANGAPTTAPTATPTTAPTNAADAPPSEPTGKSILVSKGYIIPAHQISISPIEVSGRIVELAIEEGKRFSIGEVLARIDPTSYQADYQEMASMYQATRSRFEELQKGPRSEELTQANAELSEARANLVQFRLDYERNKDLKGGAISNRELEQSEAAFKAGEQRVRRLEQVVMLLTPRQERKDAAMAEMAAAEARMKRAKWRLDNCWIRAPVSGTILSKKAEIGNLINPVVGGVSTSLCDMADLSDLEVDLEIQERDLEKIKNGYRCEIRAEAYPTRVYAGYVDRQMPIANRARGIVPIRVKVIIPPTEEQGKYLKPEMGVSVTFFDAPFTGPKPKVDANSSIPEERSIAPEASDPVKSRGTPPVANPAANPAGKPDPANPPIPMPQPLKADKPTTPEKAS
ncbi:HlyD family secretion protein [Tuwongella immobilis]|uniref:Multidrug resistance protein MdtA-like barrel-sandwich hybrid domain-containing protein n=1 Tax=Tuwongella immobilis TaxID=692036 RepID=A0A6C2YTQ0_9BACT|nr:efflux RND transporter periplasmic adaptor subunit [Tuwongella immobilis]VIP04295.1 Secretion protein HlyD family protein OS=Pirellula staleyi (strain ATCC 27377 / DSM 6068 / ICPB 4128) GN=Psta_2961 PE=4 SV=1: HlyD [Tuwongella immobilis]VTS05953.1 Secretion protein HlyD family protein OS=Pirellula staleyi (strain ATCC 27377 / DSM 6068 / ICPB 4128) GN=Psta_2961 PE=4 SV=1: HlyD [Tuwongella immobilis]